MPSLRPVRVEKKKSAGTLKSLLQRLKNPGVTPRTRSFWGDISRSSSSSSCAVQSPAAGAGDNERDVALNCVSFSGEPLERSFGEQKAPFPSDSSIGDVSKTPRRTRSYSFLAPRSRHCSSSPNSSSGICHQHNNASEDDTDFGRSHITSSSSAKDMKSLGSRSTTELPHESGSRGTELNASVGRVNDVMVERSYGCFRMRRVQCPEHKANDQMILDIMTESERNELRKLPPGTLSHSDDDRNLDADDEHSVPQGQVLETLRQLGLTPPLLHENDAILSSATSFREFLSKCMEGPYRQKQSEMRRGMKASESVDKYGELLLTLTAEFNTKTGSEQSFEQRGMKLVEGVVDHSVKDDAPRQPISARTPPLNVTESVTSTHEKEYLETTAMDRMKDVCKIILFFCSNILKPNTAKGYSESNYSIGDHILRRFLIKHPVSGRDYVSLLQEQNTFRKLRTADHFCHTSQTIHSSMKVTMQPRVEIHARGARMYIHMDAPYDTAEQADAQPGHCYVELGGASGHHGRKGPELPPNEREIYTFTLPSLKIVHFLKGAPVAELVGHVEIKCVKTGLGADLHFVPYQPDNVKHVRNLIKGGIYKLGQSTDQSSTSSSMADLPPFSHVSRSHGESGSMEVMQRGEYPSKTIMLRSPIKLVQFLGTWDSEVHIMETTQGSESRVLYTDGEFLPAVRPLTTSAFTVSIADALQQPSLMELKRLWSCIVDALNRTDFGQPGNMVRDRLVQTNKLPFVARKMQLEDNRPMVYEMAHMVCDTVPDGEAPLLPKRFGGVGL